MQPVSPSTLDSRRPIKPAVAWAQMVFVTMLGLAVTGGMIGRLATNASIAKTNPMTHADDAAGGGSYRIDINHAPADDLAVLPGVGPTLAMRIVEYRQRFGPFTQPRQLEAVARLGPVTRQRIEPWIRLKDERTSPTRLADQSR